MMESKDQEMFSGIQGQQKYPCYLSSLDVVRMAKKLSRLYVGFFDIGDIPLHEFEGGF